MYEIKIPKEHHGYVLGKQGAKLKQIEQCTNTKISIPKPDNNSDVIKITGNREDSDLAKEELRAISDDLVREMCIVGVANIMWVWLLFELLNILKRGKKDIHWIKDTYGAAILSFVRRLSYLWRLKMY